MTDYWTKLTAVSFFCHAIAFALILISSIFAYSLGDTLPEFQWNWIMAQTWAEFISLAPVAEAWAVLITFSLIIPMQGGGPTRTSFERFGSSIITLLIITLAFTVAYGIGHPRAVNNRTNLNYSSDFARSLMETAEEALAGQDYERALTALGQYVGIVGESEIGQGMLRDARRQVQLEATRRSEDKAAEGLPIEGPERDGAEGSQEFAARARSAQAAEDYSTAHYLATLALALDESNDEAAQVAAEALQRLAENTPDDKETAEAALFRSKQSALDNLGRQKVIDAYYQLKKLEEEYPNDGDVERYLAIATQQVAGLTLFLDDVKRALQGPGSAGFAFINASDESSRELVSIGKLVRTSSGLYAQHIEVMRFTLDGDLQYHLTSTYGKLLNGALVFTVLDPENPDAILRPDILHGERNPETENLLRIIPNTDELWLLAVASADLSGASITDLFRMAGSLRKYGLLTEPIKAEMLYRLALPFTFLILSILVLGFSWRYRSRYLGRPPIGTFIIVPIAPIVLLPVYLFLQFANRIVLSAMLLWTGLTVGIALLFVLESILLAAALMYLALSDRE